jgi:hypothetical protein
MTINMTISNYMIINYDYIINRHVEIIDLVQQTITHTHTHFGFSTYFYDYVPI